MRTSSHPKETDQGTAEKSTSVTRVDPGFPIEQGAGGQGSGGGTPAKPPNQSDGEPGSVSPKKRVRKIRRGAVPKKASPTRRSA